jgi:hypothetical protein
MIMRVKYRVEINAKVIQMMIEVLFEVSVDFVSICSKLMGLEIFACMM